MTIQQLSLTQFKNYTQEKVLFHKKFVGIVGYNGMGKTNLLDAIHYISMCRGLLTHSDSNLIQHGTDFFRLEATITNDLKPTTFVAKVQPKKKEISINNVVYERLADHVGVLPLVVVHPYDQELVLEGSEMRRKYIDVAISQCFPEYLKALIAYNKLLLNRNNALKTMVEKKKFDDLLLHTYSKKMETFSDIIVAHRKTFFEEIQPIHSKFHQEISDNNETVELIYKSDLLTQQLIDLHEENLAKDKVIGRTTTGVQKDDITFKIKGQKLKTFASQGQMKSFIIALKLAQYGYIYQNVREKPVLLLDDIFDKLDDRRVELLMNILNTGDFGQIFITDTSYERFSILMKKQSIEHQIIQVDNGGII